MGINRRAQDLHALQPDPLEPIAEEVERYVGALQEFAETDPDLAGRQAWNQIRLAGMRGGRRRSEVLDSLNRIFRLGTVPEPPLDGPCDGLVVTTRTFALTDPLFRVLVSIWMPWVGKRFDAETMSGDNLMLPSARAGEARLAELPVSGHRGRSLRRLSLSQLRGHRCDRPRSAGTQDRLQLG